MKTLTLFAALMLAACVADPAAAQTTTTAATPADVVGSWNATVTTAQGQSIPSQLVLKKDGEKLVGTISSHMGEVPVQADVKGTAVTIWFNIQGQNGPLAIELAGTVDRDTAKGTMAVGGQAGGDWIATRGKESKETPSLTGTWNVSVELPSMTASPTMVLTQNGEKLTGEYISAQYGKFAVTGTTKGPDVSFWFAMNVEGTALNVTYTGTVEKDGSLKGSVNYGDMMSGTFVASKKK